ncbi:MAG: PadR family transcriptional regulator [Clostridia bacterium]|nr:PadR family transcriptional regulator [Clostridia bacterium]MBQ2709651.1 PadR family transcriptional regulator [Clostridia bacterium]
MDIQLKRGLLEVLVLATLTEGESYGYALVKAISGCVDISESTLYPILRRLEAADMLTVTSREYNGRLRKYYQITDAGRARVGAFVEEQQEMMKIFRYIEERQGTHDES